MAHQLTPCVCLAQLADFCPFVVVFVPGKLATVRHCGAMLIGAYWALPKTSLHIDEVCQSSVNLLA